MQIKNLNNKPVVLYTFYRPPNSTHNSLNELNDSLQSNVEKDYVVVVGDFNLPELRWSEDQTTPNSSTGQTGESFCELFNDNFLQQHIVGSTHSGGNKLDLLLSNHPEVVHDVRGFFPINNFQVITILLSSSSNKLSNELIAFAVVFMISEECSFNNSKPFFRDLRLK